MACAMPIMEQERKFLDFMNQSETINVTGNTLTINDGNGKSLVFKSENETFNVTLIPERELPANAKIQVFLQSTEQAAKPVVLGSSEVSFR